MLERGTCYRVLLAMTILLCFYLFSFETDGSSKGLYKSWIGSSSKSLKWKRPPLKEAVRDNCPSRHFSDVLLVVVFNFPFYKNVKLLRTMYEHIFPNIYFCGPESNGVHHPEIHRFELRRGYYGYACMANAIASNPGHRGYLYTNDDIIMNWWNLMDFDLNRVWQGPHNADFTQYAYAKKHNAWTWWKTEMGLIACQKVYEDIKILASNDTYGFKEVLSNYLVNGNGKPRCGRAWSDLFYVPGRLAKMASRILFLSYEHNLFLEIAVQNMLRMLSRRENIEILNGLFLPDVGVFDSSNAALFWNHYSTNLTFIHPFKLNSGRSSKINRAVLKIIESIGSLELKSRCGRKL